MKEVCCSELDGFFINLLAVETSLGMAAVVRTTCICEVIVVVKLLNTEKNDIYLFLV